MTTKSAASNNRETPSGLEGMAALRSPEYHMRPDEDKLTFTATKDGEAATYRILGAYPDTAIAWDPESASNRPIRVGEFAITATVQRVTSPQDNGDNASPEPEVGELVFVASARRDFTPRFTPHDKNE